MKKYFAILAALFILIIAACSSGGGDEGVHKKNYISGKIAFGDKGVAGVKVSLSGESSAETTSDNNGYYIFTDQKSGDYIVTAYHAGYVFSPAGTAVQIKGENKTGIDFTVITNTTPKYSISGRVNGIVTSGVQITLAGTLPGSAITDVNGNYNFDSVINGSYTLTASKAGYAFDPTSISVTINNADVTVKNFTSKIGRYIISGIVSGEMRSGVTVTLTGPPSCPNNPTLTDVSGYYSFVCATNGDYTITPSATGYKFCPESKNVTVNNADATGQNFTAILSSCSCTDNNRISGSVMGEVTSGVTVTLTGTQSSSTMTEWSGGYYIFYCLAKGDYTITPTMTGYKFCPDSRNVTVSGVAVTGQDFKAIASCCSCTDHSISGRVSGEVKSNVTVTLTGTQSTSATTDSNGYYIFQCVTDGDYTITPSKTGYKFCPDSRNVTVSGADVTEQDFTAILSNCSCTEPYKISGTVSGVVNAGVTVTLTGTQSSSAMTDSNGYYIFQCAANGDYTITPTKTGYKFCPESKNVTVNNADVTGQDFTSIL